MKRVFLFFILVKISENLVIVPKVSNSRKDRFKMSPEVGSVGRSQKIRYKGPDPCERRIQFNVTGQSTTIKSPGYPFNYFPNLRCLCFASSPPGTRMRLDCEDFNLEKLEKSNGTDQCDYATFLISLEGNFSSPQGIVNTCGTGTIRQVSVSNKLTIFFGSKKVTAKSISPLRFFCTIKVVRNPSTTRPKPARKCSCGESKLKRETRIVGGVRTELNEFPWRCCLFNASTGYYCGCAVISDQWVITAAHCATAVGSAKHVRVNIGDYDLSRSDDVNSQLVPVSKFILHPLYDSQTQDNDLSLLKLGKKLVFGDNVQPVCLPFKFMDKSLQGMNTKATGWGLDDYGGKQNFILQKVNLTILETQECRDFAEYPSNLLTDNMFCAYGDGEKRDTCQGDSGGGINIYDKESRRWFEVGINSWGFGCAREENPGVYTKLTLRKYLDWIHAITGPDLCVVE